MSNIADTASMKITNTNPRLIFIIIAGNFGTVVLSPGMVPWCLVASTKMRSINWVTLKNNPLPKYGKARLIRLFEKAYLRAEIRLIFVPIVLKDARFG